MVFRLQLCDQDRELFGLPEGWLEWSPANISINDLDELSGRFGFDPDEWPLPFYGQLTFEQAGDPEAKPKPPPWRARAVIWMLLRQNGYDVSWEETGKAHPYMSKFKNDDPDVTPGKDPDPSPPSAPSTTRRSRTSSGSRKRT